MDTSSLITLRGTLRLSDATGRRTCGGFGKLITDNEEVFQRFFGEPLFPGSLNVDVPEPTSLQRDLDAGRPAPTLVVPRTALINMPSYIGDGQAWASYLRGNKFPHAIKCWVFRRIGSRVPIGVIEIVASEPLRVPYKLKHGDPVVIELLQVASARL
jgi:CTP-dependent riboflavin kinase